ncbi:MAG: DNA internalization-related competence protein ComEC/Rec2 [Nitrospirae bacterium]|nr:DNA internalization-related competence protein ComEC/Rec2 [Nitrospirota bacterium]
MERPMAWAAICCLSGLILREIFTYFPLTVFGFAIIVIVWIYVLHGREGRPTGLFLLVAGLVLLGMIRFQVAAPTLLADDPGRFVRPEPLRVIGVVDEPLQHGPESTLVILKVQSVLSEGGEHPVGGRLRLTVRDFVPDIEYGDLVSLETRLRPVAGLRNPGGFDYAAALQRDGIRATAVLHRPEVLTRLAAGGFAPLRRIYAWREQIRQRLDGSLSPVSSSILQSMLIGETGSLSPEVREAFMISGTTHLLSISGSHLAMVSFVVFWLSGRILKRMPVRWLLSSSRRLTVTRLSVLITLVPVIFYTLLAGAQVATVRSLVMILVYLAAVWFQRADDPLNALAVAALLLLLWQPQAVFSISFQLSYIAVLAMVLKGEKQRLLRDNGSGTGEDTKDERSQIGLLWEKVRAYLSMTFAAGVSTLPLTAYYFNQVAWVGFLSNLIIVPLVGMVIVPLGLACSVGAILFGSTSLPLAGLNDLLTRGLFSMIEWFARFPAAELHVPSPPVPVLMAVYLAGLLLLIVRGKQVRTWSAIGLCFLILTVWIARVWASHPDGRLRVTFLDVGQGDAAWIEMPDGKTMLMDGGGAYGNFDLGRLAVAPYLWNTGRYRIDYLVASHPQLDHMGGLGYLAKKFNIGEIWTNGLEKDADFYRRFREIVSAKAIPEKRITSDDRPLNLGGVRILPLHPEMADPDGPDNDQCLVIRMEYGKEAILFTGDIERAAERELLRWGDLLKTTVLKVPHHGSRTSIDPDFLSRVAPAVAVISVGAHNSYRHPSPETLAAYESKGARIYRTDRDGAVILETDGIRRTMRTVADGIVLAVPLRWDITAGEAANWRKIVHRYWSGPA